MLVLRPVGRGNWHTIEVRFNGRRSPRPIGDYFVGGIVTLGDGSHHVAYRVVRIMP